MRKKALIEHPLLQPFEPQLKAILEFAFDGGVRSLNAAGYKLGDDLVNDDAREHFRNGLFSAPIQQWLPPISTGLGPTRLLVQNSQWSLAPKIETGPRSRLNAGSTTN
jgi:hypothetical protein